MTTSTRITRHVNAPRTAVYRALLDAREGGAFRISLTYDAPAGTGKTTAQTDTFHGRFIRLVPDETLVEAVEFGTGDLAMPGLSPADNELGWRMSLGNLAALVEARR